MAATNLLAVTFLGIALRELRDGTWLSYAWLHTTGSKLKTTAGCVTYIGTSLTVKMISSVL